VPDSPDLPLLSIDDLRRLLDEVTDLSTEGPLSIAERLRLLIRLVRDPQTGAVYSQKFIAEKTGLNNSAISRILSMQNREPKVQTLQRLADFFQVPLAYFTSPDIGAELRRQLQQLPRADAVGQQLEEMGVLSTNLRVLDDTAPVTSLGARAERVAQELDQLAQHPHADKATLERHIAAMESMAELLREATLNNNLRRGRSNPPA
jgi:transcriptional regulator with XRE-family HTH domain